MISVFNYQDPIHYLSDFLNNEKKLKSDFSLKTWAQSIGLKSSAPLVEVLKKQRPLKSSLVTKLINHIGLDKTEYLYFIALVAKVKSSTELEQELFELLTHDLSPRKNNDVYSVKRFEEAGIFSHWIFTTIFTMTALKDFELTTENIQKALKESLSLKEIETAMDKLLALGLLEKSEGKIQRKFVEVTTKTDQKHPESIYYYSQMTDLAKKSLTLPVEGREFQSFSLCLKKEQMSLAKNIIRECRNKLAALSSEGGDEIFQMNMFLFPMTDRSTSSDEKIE